MSTIERLKNEIELAKMPAVPGLCFRHFQGESDYPKMVAVMEGTREVDEREWVSSVEETAVDYAHLINCDPHTDMIFAEVDDEVVGYGRCWWSNQVDGSIAYRFFAHLLPAWRSTGIRLAMVRFLKQRIRQIAATHPADKEKNFLNWGMEAESDWINLLLAEGHEVVRYGLEMVRPNLDNIPDCPLPDSLEVRCGSDAESRQIWEAAREAFRDHWGMSEWSEESYTGWSEYPTYQPHLWQIAWAGDEVAGGVLNFIDHKENADNGRLRGYTETIFVRRPWRKLGVAKALIARSFQVLKDEGMTEAALGVDAENLSGALHLYRKMGFEEYKRGMTFRKPL
ncbi:MAG: GNAT family N-acetyltransferase [Ardenticatenaceae bacterium]|nr:GNAT family N-acetyltransferase [Ardenticatenaceae bacterium]MCB8975138.1 GNAT family N-acetyltransferase [Ardenticatenaceae bacterium]